MAQAHLYEDINKNIVYINMDSYKQYYKPHLGSLMFPDKYYDCTCLVDLKYLRRENRELLRGQRIKKVLCLTANHKDFRNEANNHITYKEKVFSSESQDGSFRQEGFYWSLHPLGKIIIVI